jgi:outer membrane lipoprotein SlyB
MSSTSFVKMHPLVAAAAASVIIVSMVGTAAIMDWLPMSKSKEAPEMSAASTPTPSAATPANAEGTQAATSESAKTSQAPATQTHKKSPSHAAASQASPASTTTQAAGAQPQTLPPVAQAPAICDTCGKVEGVRSIEVAAKPSGVGVVAGAVVGGLLGNQLGGGSGKTLATVAGAVGGGYAGNEIEKRTHKGTAWEVDVRMENGEKRSFKYDTQPSWRAGDRVKVVNGALAAN